jgi:hypothetical protein
MSFVREQFDKLLLVLMFTITISLALFMAHYPGDQQYVSWAKEMTTGILGALLLRINSDRKAVTPPDAKPTP